MRFGVHLPLMGFGTAPYTVRDLVTYVETATSLGFEAVCANDHVVFGSPWLDGPTALAAVVSCSGNARLVTTAANPVVRGPAVLAKALATLDVLSGGRVVAGLAPGSSDRDYASVGVPFDERWPRFDEAVAQVRALLGPGSELEPGPWRPGGVPLWIGSWGSRAGLARVASAGDGWLASAYNTTPERFSAARAALAPALEDRGRDPTGFPNALATMWTWVSKDRAEGDRVLADLLAPLLKRDRDELREQVCVGPAEHCSELLSRYAEAGCDRVYLWPLGDERRQLELIAEQVAPQVSGSLGRP
jgi:alkanesulfonate monooxygenase SsuD/methylene tetrahydromethanopterin reductase-like flavin-dependent oxidoreductase (luciferase family)